MRAINHIVGVGFTLLICVVNVCGGEPFPKDLPNHKPPASGEHPRLFFRKADVPALRARAKTPEGQKMVAQLRLLLGNDGESLPTVYNQHLPRNLGPKGQTELPIGAFTFSHPVGYGMLYQLTGDKKYAQLAKESLERMFDADRYSMTGKDLKEAFEKAKVAPFQPKGPRWEGKDPADVVMTFGERDRDERYTWTFPGAGMRRGVMSGWIAVAYDLNYDAWDDAFRKRVQEELLDKEYPLVDYQKYGQGGKNPLLSFEEVLFTKYKPTSNHYGASIGGAVMTLLALRGDPGVDKARVETLLEKAEKRAADGMSGFNAVGWYAEGYGPSHLMSNAAYVPMLQAARVAWGKDFVYPRQVGQWLTLRWVMLPVPDAEGKPWYPNVEGTSYGSDFMDHGPSISWGGEWSQGFGTLTDEGQKGALLWMWNHSWGKQYEDFDAAVYPHRAVMALINWPIGMQEVNPAEVIGRTAADHSNLHYLHRNQWKDEKDILFSFLGNADWRHGNIRTPNNGVIAIYGLGERHYFGSGFRSKKQRKGPYEETYYKAEEDGSGVITLRRVDALHGLCIDYSGTSGAAAVIGFADPWFNTEKVKIRRSKVLKTHSLEAGGRSWFFMTLNEGDHPVPEAVGDNVKIGDRIYAYDGEKIVME